ncbi:MAG: hypothetical protein ACKN9V_05730 [Pseudomonadota bacterium]
MVIHLLFFLVSFVSAAESESPFIFRLEVSSSKVFQGEQVTANFFLEAPSERAVEIEVMKFPEFRGFWSENLVLRQGPVHLIGTVGPKKRAIALIGSYSLSSILDIQSPALEPMRILVKSFGQPPIILNSEGQFPPLSPLPPIPARLNEFPFSGAVGTFQLVFSQTQIPFRKNQPFVIRGQLQGQGNFSEINTLPLSPPNELSLVSQSSSLDSFSGGSRKSFEWIFSTEKDSLNEWNPGSFLTFSPQTKTYQIVSLPSFKFVALPETAVPANRLKMGAIPFLPELSWRARTRLQDSGWFWIMQVTIALVLIARGVWVQIRIFQERRLQDPFLRRQLILKQASLALKNENWEEFLSLASKVARQLIQEKSSLVPLDSLQLWIEADNELRFSPSKSLTVSEETLKSEWKNLQKKVD